MLKHEIKFSKCSVSQYEVKAPTKKQPNRKKIVKHLYLPVNTTFEAKDKVAVISLEDFNNILGNGIEDIEPTDVKKMKEKISELEADVERLEKDNTNLSEAVKFNNEASKELLEAERKIGKLEKDIGNYKTALVSVLGRGTIARLRNKTPDILVANPNLIEGSKKK